MSRHDDKNSNEIKERAPTVSASVPALSRPCPVPADAFEAAWNARMRALGRLPGQVGTVQNRRPLELLGLVDRAAPARWTSELVASRLEEAQRTLARMPMATRPGAYKTIWPGFQGMTEKERRDLEFELYHEGKLAEWQADRNRTRPLPPSKEAIGRMEQSLIWPLRYLAGDPGAAAAITCWLADRKDDDVPAPARVAMRAIARGLNRDGVEVR